MLGPLLGAAVLAVTGWRAIFWLNLDGALLLAAWSAPADAGRPAAPRPAAVLALALAVLGAASLAVVLRPPDASPRTSRLGQLVLPLAGDSADSPWRSRRPSCSPVGRRGRRRPPCGHGACRTPTCPGCCCSAAALAGIVLTFAGADTTRSVVDDRWPVYLCLAVLAAARVRRPAAHGPDAAGTAAALCGRRRPRALAVNALVGVALVAVLVDVPVFARVTRFPTSQLGAALVLLEFLAALPVGRARRRVGAAAGRPLAPSPAVASRRRARAGGRPGGGTRTALYGAPAQLLLVVAGFGFGLAVAPVNAVLLASTAAAVHGLASALAVLARTVGMLVGLSVLTRRRPARVRGPAGGVAVAVHAVPVLARPLPRLT